MNKSIALLAAFGLVLVTSACAEYPAYSRYPSDAYPAAAGDGYSGYPSQYGGSANPPGHYHPHDDGHWNQYGRGEGRQEQQDYQRDNSPPPQAYSAEQQRQAWEAQQKLKQDQAQAEFKMRQTQAQAQYEAAKREQEQRIRAFQQQQQQNEMTRKIQQQQAEASIKMQQAQFQAKVNAQKAQAEAEKKKREEMLRALQGGH